MSDALRDEIRAFLGLREARGPAAPRVEQETSADGHVRKLVTYAAPDGERIEAFLFEPLGGKPRAGVVVLHQHNSEWDVGKSEVAGLLGDPMQAFGPALARAGVAVLAPDAVGFESRRGRTDGDVRLAPAVTRPHGSAEGWLQYYNHAMHRLVRGELLLTKILSDVAAAVSALEEVTRVERIGVAGHSFGGNIVLFAAALDTRVAFACASGAACSYRHKLAAGTGLEMALVVPGFAARWDFEHLIRCVAPRRLLVVSSDADPYSADADDLVRRAESAAWRPEHLHVAGPHALDARRFDAIVSWLAAQG